MIAAGKDELFCDLAETYHIFNWKQLPASTLAVLAVGLSDDSRIKRKINGTPARSDILLLAAAVDRLSMLLWAQTEDGQKGRNRPQSIVESMMGEKKEEVRVFRTPEEFMEVYNRIHNVGEENG